MMMTMITAKTLYLGSAGLPRTAVPELRPRGINDLEPSSICWSACVFYLSWYPGCPFH